MSIESTEKAGAALKAIHSVTTNHRQENSETYGCTVLIVERTLLSEGEKDFWTTAL